MIRAALGNERFSLLRSLAGELLTLLRPKAARFTEQGSQPAGTHAFAQEEHSTEAVEQSLQSILGIVPAVVLVLDSEGNVAWANERAIRMFGYASGEIRGVCVQRLLAPTEGDGRPVSIETFRAPQGLCSTTRDAIARPNSGANIEVRVTTSVVRMQARKAWMVVLIEPDIDAAATVVPEDGQRRLRWETPVKIGDMAAALAHEVGQPLTAILSNAQAAQRFLAQSPPALDELQELLGEVVDDSTRAHAIIRRMRLSARAEPAQVSLLDADSLIQDVIRRLRRETEVCGATVEARVEGDIPQLSGDAVQLQQVLVNLLSNALDAVHGCHAQARKVCVAAAAAADRRSVKIDVCDNGHGVDARQFATLFKPFVTTKPQGLGLGLSISRTIVMAHGGHLWAECNADCGMTFHIELPVETTSTTTGLPSSK